MFDSSFLSLCFTFLLSLFSSSSSFLTFTFALASEFAKYFLSTIHFDVDNNALTHSYLFSLTIDLENTWFYCLSPSVIHFGILTGNFILLSILRSLSNEKLWMKTNTTS
jgi:hypothetical protein